MDKFYGAPAQFLLELQEEANEKYPNPRDRDMIISRDIVLTSGKFFYIGKLRLEYDVYCGWIPLPHEQVSPWYKTKADAIDEYVKLSREARNVISKPRSSDSSCSS